MKSRYRILVLLFLTLPLVVIAQQGETPVDTTAVNDTTTTFDTTIVDSLTPVDTISTDTLSDVERARASFQERFEQNKQEKVEPRVDRVSFFDSLAQYYLNDRFNKRDDIDRSYYHDAGDYVRSLPAFNMMQYQVTPMRKTVSPFGLTGDRLSLITNGQSINPFEHIPEPDGMVDLEAMPTVMDDGVYALEGPIGLLFGADNATASIVTKHVQPEGTVPSTNFSADKGSFGYSWVKGRYTGRFSDGRKVDAGVEYRKADGPALGRQSEDYQYYGDLYFPLKSSLGIRTWGYLYDRAGPLLVRPENGGNSIKRNKFDRQLKISLTRDDGGSAAHSELGFKYEHHGSSLTGLHGGRYRTTEYGAFASRDWVKGRTAMSLSAEGDNTEYDNGFDKYNRLSSEFVFRLARLTDQFRYAVVIGAKSAERFGILPQAMFTMTKEGDRSYFSITTGYSSKAPSMHELYLPASQSSLYGTSVDDYAEAGNSELENEHQLISSVTAQLGTARNNVGMSVTGGRIINGIDWYNSPNGLQTLFKPDNDNIDFVTATIQPRITINDFLSVLGGGSYHWLEQDQYDRPAYSPEYQAFSGVELHLDWQARLIDLFAYGEVVYVGPYDGYQQTGMGNYLIANAKLSFALKDFRMYFVFQNALSEPYRSREYLTLPGRYFYYGLSWNFLN